MIELGEQLRADPPPDGQIIHKDTRPRRRRLRRRRRQRVRCLPLPPRHSTPRAAAQVATHREATVKSPEARCTLAKALQVARAALSRAVERAASPVEGDLMREVIRDPQRSSGVVSGYQRSSGVVSGYQRSSAAVHTEALDASRRVTKLCAAAECVERPCQMEARERSPTCSSA